MAQVWVINSTTNKWVPQVSRETWESTDASGTTTYSYDSMDRLTVKATPEGTLNYSYDAGRWPRSWD